MSDFLVHIRTSIPADIAPAQWSDIVAAERTRGADLRRAGVILHIWRVPTEAAGVVANVGVWRADDESALTRAIGTLPARPWMHVEITPLTPHPLADVTRGS